MLKFREKKKEKEKENKGTRTDNLKKTHNKTHARWCSLHVSSNPHTHYHRRRGYSTASKIQGKNAKEPAEVVESRDGNLRVDDA